MMKQPEKRHDSKALRHLQSLHGTSNFLSEPVTHAYSRPHVYRFIYKR